MLAHYEEYGLLPVWDLLANETNTMTGYHAIPVIVDAYLKGYRDYDVEKAYEAMKTSAMQDIRGTNFYREFGFIPYDKAGQSVTRTLEYSYDDWCIAQMAKALGKEKDYQTFSKRAKSYEAMFNPATGFMQAKYANEKWKTPFDPKYSDHNFDVAEYTEGNAWQHSWFTPHAPMELIELHGGNKNFVKKLDSLFSAMGFYPFNPADGKYQIGSPLFEKIEIPIDDNKTFTLIAKNASKENKYIQSITWNGKNDDRYFITHDDIKSGGTLEIEMGNSPKN